MATALIAIGSNLGDSLAAVRGAVAAVGDIAGVASVRAGRIFRSRPVGGPGGQREFLNTAAVVDASLSPEALLASLEDVENRFGRRRAEQWGPRTLDLDLLLFDELVLDQPELTLPHPRMSFRRFVLEPAADVAAEMRHPVLGCTLGELLRQLDTAPHYVAIGGLDTAARTWLATTLGRTLDAPVLGVGAAGLTGESAAAHSSVPPLSQVLEFVKRASCLVHRAYWRAHPELRPLLEARLGGAEDASDIRPAVSDFWIDQWRLWSCLWGPSEGASQRAYDRQWLEMVEVHLAEVVAPKLVIWLDAVASLSPKMQENLPMCLDRLFRTPPCHALLRLDAGDPDRILAEGLAAIEAMEPLEGVVS